MAVLSSGATIAEGTFTRLLSGHVLNDEEVRRDIPLTFSSAYAYVAIGPAGASPLDPVWACIRTSYDANGRSSRVQYREAVAWSDRTIGW
jgi:hypothetical protein